VSDPQISVSAKQDYDPNDGVPTLGWTFVTLRGRKIRCAMCGRWTRVAVVNHNADPATVTKCICKRCWDDMP
jgi:hypothetical protein